ncbi:threonine-tRNA ligase [Verruconis gallopava]|uniref:threonine--tRNA ligase n=1 Tax=Verruconis gallopava TaxID=253628 RepID=A0A0D1Y1S9_9PEZI|nr:threonine-tRNA ligase [Verruconis gallopava]KIW08996.1 threonine-tRNA ligase [Verruconis gallopava]
MPRMQQSILRGLFNSRRSSVFRHHTRIAASIFARPCSCTAALRESDAPPSPSLRTVAHDPPKPPADHRKLATKQKLFITSPYSPGSPLLLPNGADMFVKLQNLLRGLYPHFGFREVITPTIYKKSLWEKSGHWENYAEDMFEVKGRGASGRTENVEIGEDEEFGLKPMNCPGHCLLFASETRSYRDLPIRFADFSALHRNEISGALTGLTRVRRFHQDDGHIFCRPSQVEDEIKKTLEFIELIYSKIFDLGPYRLVLSTRPQEHYIGTLEEWNRAEDQLRAALDHSGQAWSVNEGDGAFYGPKIDIILKDSDGKEHQTATIQLDFQLPKRFGLEYAAPDVDAELRGESDYDHNSHATPGPVTPIIVHRAVLGSLERFMALLIEHYDGLYPFWISPRPAILLTASQDDAVLAYAKDIQASITRADCGQDSTLGPSAQHEYMLTHGLERSRESIVCHFDLDSSERSLSKKIRLARTEGYNFLLVVGPKDLKDQTVTVQLWNHRRPDIVASMLGADGVDKAKVKGFQTQLSREDAVGLFKTLCAYHL